MTAAQSCVLHILVIMHSSINVYCVFRLDFENLMFLTVNTTRTSQKQQLWSIARNLHTSTSPANIILYFQCVWIDIYSTNKNMVDLP